MNPAVLGLALLAAGAADRFIGEKICYDAIVFKALNVGQACIEFQMGEGEGLYVAAITGIPNSFAKNFTHVRKVLMRTVMVENADRTRLLPYRVERALIRDTGTCGTVYILAGRRWNWVYECDGAHPTGRSEGSLPIPETPYFDDPVAAVYNLRSGFYGERTPGTSVTLTTLSYDGTGRLTLSFLPPGTSEVNGGPPGAEVRYKMHITEEGNALGVRFRDIVAWVGPGDVPLRFFVQGLIPLTNLRGELKPVKP